MERMFLYADFANPQEDHSVLSLYGVKVGVLYILDSRFVRGRFKEERNESIKFILEYWKEYFGAPITKHTETILIQMPTKADRIMRLQEQITKGNIFV